MSDKIGEYDMKRKANAIRLEIMALKDDDLIHAQAESFGNKFETLAQMLVTMAEKAKRDLPF